MAGSQLLQDDNFIYRAAVGQLICLSLPLVPQWETLLLPALSDAVDTMMATGHLPIETAEALDDIGHFCQRLSADIFAERTRRGIPLPPGPDEG